MLKNTKIILIIIFLIVLFIIFTIKKHKIKETNTKIQPTEKTVRSIKKTNKNTPTKETANYSHITFINESDFLKILSLLTENSQIKIDNKFFIEDIISLEKENENNLKGNILWKDNNYIYINKKYISESLTPHYQILYDKDINKIYLINGFISFNYINDITYLKNIENFDIISVFEKEKLAIAKIHKNDQYFDIFNTLKNDLNLENVKLEYISYMIEEK